MMLEMFSVGERSEVQASSAPRLSYYKVVLL